MNVRIWLNHKVDLECGGGIRDETVCGEAFGDAFVVTIKTQEQDGIGHLPLPYIEIGDPFDPTTKVPQIPDKFVEKVTLRDIIHTGLKPDGVYFLSDAPEYQDNEAVQNARLLVRTTTCKHELIQSILASGPTLQAVKDLYHLVRAGYIQPKFNWGGPPDQPADAAPNSTPTSPAAPPA